MGGISYVRGIQECFPDIVPWLPPNKGVDLTSLIRAGRCTNVQDTLSGEYTRLARAGDAIARVVGK